MRLLIRALSLSLLLLPTRPAEAAVQIVMPPQGSQVIGKGYVEISTSTAAVDRLEIYVDGVLVGVARQAPWWVAADFGDAIAPHEIEARLYSNHYATRESDVVNTTGMSASQTFNVDLVEVPLKIRSARKVKGNDIEIREDGLVQKILELKPTRSATHFTFVVDHSLSMAGGKLSAALSGLKHALSDLREGDSADLILFNHRVETPRAFTRSSSVADFNASGGTSLRDAVATAAGAGRGIIVVVSDGDDRNSMLSEKSALQVVGKSNVTLYALTLGSGSGSRFLESAAETSGGQTIRSSRSALSRDLEQLMDDINSAYVAEYQSSNSRTGWRTVTVTARSRGVAVLSSRKGFYSE